MKSDRILQTERVRGVKVKGKNVPQLTSGRMIGTLLL